MEAALTEEPAGRLHDIVERVPRHAASVPNDRSSRLRKGVGANVRCVHLDLGHLAPGLDRTLNG